VADDLATLARMVRLGAATNTAVMTEGDVRALLSDVGIDRYLEVVVTSHDAGAAKPDPAVLVLAIERLGHVDPGVPLRRRSAERSAAADAAGMHFVMVGDDGVLAAVLRWVGTREPTADSHERRPSRRADPLRRLERRPYAARRSARGVRLQSPQRMLPASRS